MPVRNNLKKGLLLARDLREFSHTAACLLTGWCDWDSLHSRKQRVDFLLCSPPFFPLTKFFFGGGGNLAHEDAAAHLLGRSSYRIFNYLEILS